MIPPRSRLRPRYVRCAAVLLLVSACALQDLVVQDPCTSPPNQIVAENCLEGHPATEWDINGYGDPSIQGFGTDIAIAQGESIDFKVDTDSDDYRIDIYRMGYYGGMGVRRVDSIEPSAARQPRLLRRPGRRRRVRDALPDVGPDVAGVQPLRRTQRVRAAPSGGPSASRR